MRKFFCLILLGNIFSSAVFSQGIVSGVVKDKNHKPVAYANVYVKPGFVGTTTSNDGIFEIELAPGSYTLYCQNLGYKQFSKQIEVGAGKQQIEIELTEELYSLKEVAVTNNKEDPAYEYIRKAIAKRKSYLNEVDAYSCNVYIKGVQKLNKYPEKFLGKVVDFGGMVDSTTGIFYLSESVSKYSYEKPGKIREELVSSRFSGNNKAFSYNKASDMQFNFYENRVMSEGISSKGFVSPVAGDALFYYRYKLLGSVVENDRLIHKIEVTPRRQNDPVFRGVIYIADDLWRFQFIDLFLTREAGIEFLDTLRIKQSFVPVENNVWMPVTNLFDFSFRILGFQGGGNYVGYFSDFKINPVFPAKTFSAEILKISPDANKKDSAYWDTVRPIPLTQDETSDYFKKDSLATIRESKQYKDSMDRINNKFSVFNFLLAGYSYRHSYREMTYTIKPIANTFSFNTVEGWNIALNTEFVKRLPNRKRLTVFTNTRYGFSNTHWNANAGFNYLFNRFNDNTISFEGGTAVNELNSTNPVKPLVNMLYTLWAERNYLKIYEKQFLKVSYGKEWFNGFNATAEIEYGRRNALTNTSDYTWKNFKNRTYTSNNPISPDYDIKIFLPHHYFNTHLTLTYSPFTKFITRPDGKVREESGWPLLFMHVNKAFGNVINSKTDYLSFDAGFNHQIDFGMLGFVVYNCRYYRFVNRKHVEFPDFFHFGGNKTIVSDFGTEDFAYLDYYKYSNTRDAFAIHAEYNLNRFITNKIPLIRKLKLNEIVGFHFLKVNEIKSHYELTVGLEKLGIIRADFVCSYDGKARPFYSFRFGFKLRQ